MLILLALVLVVACSVLALAVLRPGGRAASILGFYLLCYANIVLVGEITNTFHLLNRPWLWLLCHLVIAAAALLIWWRAGKPPLLGDFHWRDWRGALRQKPELWLMAGGVILAIFLNAVLIWIAPPNSNDSLATHMSRIGYWIQRGSFFPWATDRVWQVTYPVDMQLQMFWTALFLGTDRIVESSQWVGALAAMVAVFGLGRLLGADRPQAIFTALLWATFPEIVLESTTTQNDLVAGTLFAVMLYLFFFGLQKQKNGAIILSGLALGLGLGTKQTLFFMLPGFALVLLLVFREQARQPGQFRRLTLWGFSSLAAVLLFGLYMYIVNQVYFGLPVGPETVVTNQAGGTTSQSFRENLLFNSFRLAYQSVDPTGLPEPLTGYGFKLKGLVVGKLVQLIHFPVEAQIAVATSHTFDLRERYVMQEDAAWYGPLFILLVVPALIYQFIVGIKKKELLRVSIFILALTFWLFDAAFRPGWDPFQGRYFIPVVTIATPMTAFLFQPAKKFWVARWFVVALALTILTNTFLWSDAKPLSGEGNIWDSDRVTMITQQSFYMREPLQMVEKYVPADATLGLVTFNTFLEYPFFREDFSRRLVQIFPPERVQDTSWLKGQGIEYVLFLTGPTAPQLNFPSDLVPVARLGSWTLYTWNTSKR